MRRVIDPSPLVGTVIDDDRGSRRKRSMSSGILPSLPQGTATPEPRRARSLGRSSGQIFLARAHAHASDSDSAMSDAPRVKRGSSFPTGMTRHGSPLPPLPPCGSLAEVDLENGGASDTVRSDAGRGRRSSGNSRKEKRPQRADKRPPTRRPLGLLTGLAVCTLLFGPIATLLSYMRVPAAPSPDGGPRASTAGSRRGGQAPSQPDGPAGRVLHLSLAGSEIKARMVVPRNLDWAGFVAGTKERLQIEHVAHVTDHSGEGIHSVADLMHEDTLIVHQAHPHGVGSGAGIWAGGGADTTGGGAAGGGLVAGVPGSGATPLHNSPAAVAASALPPPPPLPPECGARHPTLRIAMLIPLLGSPPDFLPYFLASARASAPLVDFFLFHEGASIPWDRPPNLKLVDVGRGGLSELVGLKLGEELALPLRNATVVLRSLKLLFERWPRLVAEYKPAYGRFFAEYISGYSHWGYCDLDMAFGNVPFFVDMAEMAEQDIVSFSYGDAGGLYLRGQWTVHRNDPTVNGVWRSCPNLGAGLEKELQLKMAYLRQTSQSDGGRTHTRFVSAEGCYSKHAVAAGLRIKIAPKQAIGLRVPSGSHAVSAGGAVWHCSSDREPDGALVRELLAASAGQRCYVSLPAAQPAVGDELAVSVRDSGCGDWISAECRMCNGAPAAIAPDGGSIAYYAREGQFYGRRVDSSGLALPGPNPAGCRQAAIFHFQEWKKVWDANPGHVAVEPMGSHDTVDPNLAFSISTGGIRHIRF